MNWIDRDLKHIWHPCSQMKDYEEMPPVVVDRARGVYLYDQSGKDYIDIISSWWSNLVGHCEPRVNRAVKEQIDRLEHVLLANFSHEPVILLGEALAEIVPAGLTRFSFADCGSAAVECALKMSLQYQKQTGKPEKTGFLSLSGGYHGETAGALSVGSMDTYAAMYRPMLMEVNQVPAPDCYRCPYGENRDACGVPCFEKAEETFAVHGETACSMILEPLVQGSAGMRMYPPEYLKRLRKLCDRYDVLLIADEIATGFGRTGAMFACDHAGVTPDLMCMSKGLTGGYLPMAVTAVTEEVYEAFYADYEEGKAFLHSHTFSGNPLACAAANAVIGILREDRVLERAAKRAPFLTGLLKEALGRHGNLGEIRTMGLINAMEFVADPGAKTPLPPADRTGYRIYREALKNGLVLRPLGDVMYFNPPLTITEAEMEDAVDRCVRSVRAVLG